MTTQILVLYLVDFITKPKTRVDIFKTDIWLAMTNIGNT
jgi:hypothetical protein